MVILCFERRFSKQNSVIYSPNIKHFAPPKILVWLGHWAWCPFEQMHHLKRRKCLGVLTGLNQCFLTFFGSFTPAVDCCILIHPTANAYPMWRWEQWPNNIQCYCWVIFAKYLLKLSKKSFADNGIHININCQQMGATKTTNSVIRCIIKSDDTDSENFGFSENRSPDLCHTDRHNHKTTKETIGN